MKKSISLILAMSLCIGLLAGCSSGDSPASQPPQEPSASVSGTSEGTKVGVLVVTTQSQWCNDIIAGVTEVCNQNGAQVIVSDSQVSVDNEISGMENLINAGCSAIVVNCMNAGGLVDVCAKAQENGIFIIGWTDMLVNYDALVQEDKDAQANLVADAISSYLDDKKLDSAQMATIWLADANNPGTNAGQYKEVQENIFKTRLEDARGVEIINSQYATDTNASMNTAEAVLTANPDVKVLFCQSDEMGVAVSQVIQAKGIAAGDIFVIGLDGTDEAIKNVAAGDTCLGATVYVDTVSIGRSVGESIFTYLNSGEKQDVITQYTLVTAENAAQYVAE